MGIKKVDEPEHSEIIRKKKLGGVEIVINQIKCQNVLPVSTQCILKLNFAHPLGYYIPSHGAIVVSSSQS